MEDISAVSIMEKSPIVLGSQDGGTAPSTAPALYVLVKQPQSSGKNDQGSLVSSRDDSSLASSVSVKSKVKNCLPADCTSGSITVTLDNNNMWNEFYYRSTEMILTKQGRRMFPYCRYWIKGLESNLKYILVMDISPVDNLRYKWNGHSWEPSGKAEPHVLGRVFIHPESPSTGHYWMHQPVSFYKLKLTNNTLDQEGHIILHSMHRYLPRLHLVPAEKATEVIQLNGPDVQTFTFPQTEFFAVTAYQNIQITQLKIDYNPFAKGFRDDGLSNRLQREVKQNGNSEQETSSVNSSSSNHRLLADSDTLEGGPKDTEPVSDGMGNTDLERDSLSPCRDILGFMETDVHVSDSPVLKEEVPESPVASPCQSNSHAASPLNSTRTVSVVVKEEPVDEYDYSSVCVDGVNVKQEEAEEYSNSTGSVVEKPLKDESEMNKMEIGLHKRPQTNQLGVAQAKMLKLESGKMPVVYLEPCAALKNTVKMSDISQPVLSPSQSEKSLSDPVDSLPACCESASSSSPISTVEKLDVPNGEHLIENSGLHGSSAGDVRCKSIEKNNSIALSKETSSCNLKITASSNISLTTDVLKEGKASLSKNPFPYKVGLTSPRKRGRPRKIKLSEVGRPPKYTGKSVTASNCTSFSTCNTHLDVKPDLEDVDGVLFVSFASKEALDIHTVDRSEEKEHLQNLQISFQTSHEPGIDPDCQKIQQLEKELLEDLKSYKYKQVIHPSLQEVGLKLNLVDRTMSIDLKYLGVQLPLSCSDDYPLWKNLGTNSNSADAGLPFVSRTGKTNDFTKIKGWREKLHNSSKNEGNISEGSLKNRSAFCSDKLDEYLENEGKLMETSMGFSPSTSSYPVVYQLPTKSTSYVRTLDSVLKKQSIGTTSNTYTFKPLSVPSVSRKKREKMKNKKRAVPRGKEKSLQKPVVTSPVVTKQKRNFPVLGEKITKNQASSQEADAVDTAIVSGTEENVQGKPITMRQVQQQLQSSRLPSLSKTQVKLMDLEDCALWDGKPRTYITEERADLSLSTLLTAQASLKNKPIHKIIKRRAPACNNDFCRLGCICSSLALEKRQHTHCRKPDCMFGCTCLKRKVVLVRDSSKHKKIMEKPLHGKHRLYRAKELVGKVGDKGNLKLKDKKKKKKVEYTICDAEPEKPVQNFPYTSPPLWVKVDGETDPEPVYVPTPSAIEPMPALPDGPPSVKSAATEIKSATSGVKPPRVYTPRPNPVIREEDKDPVYLYFESMMTCARVRLYEHKKQEKKQQQKPPWNSEKNILKEHDPQPQPQSLKMEDEKELGDKSWWFSCSAGDPSISYVHHTTPGGTTKLIEIVSDCNWEKDRNEILNTLSQHVKSKMPKSFKVGNFVIDLESESKTWDNKNTAIYSSRVKISMPSCQNKGEKANISALETPNNRLASCKRTEKPTCLPPDILRKQRKKGLPFYAGLSPAGKLIAYTWKSGLNPSCLIQVNGKNYPQAKLLLGQMGALHPANRLAAYITGRLRPAGLDLSTLSNGISKVASNAKIGASGAQSAEIPTSDISKPPLSSDTTSPSSVRTQSADTSKQQIIAGRPLLDSVASQLVISAVGALHQKIAGTETSQALTGPQKLNIKPTPLSPGTTAVTAPAITVAPLVTTASLSQGTTSPPGLSPGAEKRMGPRLLLIPVHQGSPALKPPQNIQLTQGKRMILQPLRNPGGANLYRHPSGQIIQLVPLHQFQPAGPLPNVAPIMFRNSGSVVGIRLPSPSKSPVTSTCQSSVSPVTLTTKATSVTPATSSASPVLPALQPVSVLPGNSTAVAPPLLTGSPSIESPLMLSVPSSVLSVGSSATEPSSVLPSTATTEGLYTSPSTTITSELSKTSTTESSLVFSVSSSILTSTTSSSGLSVPSCIIPISPAAEISSALPMSPNTTNTSVLSRTHTTEAPLVLPVSSSILSAPFATEVPAILSVPPAAGIPVGLSIASPVTPVALATQVPSVAPVSPSINQTLKTVRAVPTFSVPATQGVPVVPPVPVASPQSGTLTLRISPSGVTQMYSDSEIASTSRQPSCSSNLVSLQSGSFALLQFPEQKNVPNSLVKQPVKNTSEKDTLSMDKAEEKVICSQEEDVLESKLTVAGVNSEENKLLEEVEEEVDPCSEGNTHTRNAAVSEIAEKDAEILEKRAVTTPTLEPDALSPEDSCSSRKTKCEENEMIISTKCSENVSDDVSCSSVSVAEGCSQTGVHKCEALQEQNVLYLHSSNKQANSEQIQSSVADSEGTGQKLQETNKGMSNGESEKPWSKHKVHTDYTEKLQKKTESSPSLPECQEQELVGWNMKEKDEFVRTAGIRQDVNGNTTSANDQNKASEKNFADSSPTFLPKRNNNGQDNCNTVENKKHGADKQAEHQSVTDYFVQMDRTGSKKSPALEDKNSVGADDPVTKSAKQVEPNVPKIRHHEKDSTPIIDITVDDTEKDEKTDDSADETVDEVSGYQSEDKINVDTLNGTESSEAEDHVDIETVEELSEKINIARLKATAAHALLSKQLHLVRDHSNKTMLTPSKQSEFSNRRPKNEEEAFANYRQTHTANERRRRKEMRGLFEKLKAALGLQAFSKVSKCFILKQAFEEIQGLTDQADKLTGQKNLLMRKQDTLIRKVSALSGKTQEVVLKKLEYIYAKQKAVEAQKKHQQAEPVEIVETEETGRASVENSTSSLIREEKPVVLSSKRAKPLILSRKGNRATEDTPSSLTLTNANLVMTANGQVLAFKSSLVPGQVAALPSTLLQADLKSEVDSSDGKPQPGITSVMIQLPGSAVPVQVKGILSNSSVPITLSAVANSSVCPAVETSPELTSVLTENDDSFMMPRIVNVTSLATEEDKHLNMDVNKSTFITLDADSHRSQASLKVVSEEATDYQPEEKGGASSEREKNVSGVAGDFLTEKDSFPQIVNVSSLKGSSDSLETKLCIEELAASQALSKHEGGGEQKQNSSSFQKGPVSQSKDSEIEMDLQNVASVIHEPALDANDLIDIEGNDDSDETLTSLLNEIAFLNQHLQDDASDISELPTSLSSGFSSGDIKRQRESTTAESSPFPLGSVAGSLKDLSVVQESSDSITPLLLHLDDDVPDGGRSAEELSSGSDALKVMLGSEIKDLDSDSLAIKSSRSGKTVQSLAKARSGTPPMLQMKASLDSSNTDVTWKPMPKLAPLGLKVVNFPLDSEGPNTKVMPSLAPVAIKEIKLTQPTTRPSQDAVAPVAKKSK